MARRNASAESAPAWLRALNFDPRQHAIGTANGEILQGNDALYSKVSDGDKLLVTEQAKVGLSC